jgi:glutathione S-transferase
VGDAYTYYDIAVMPLIRQLSKTDTEVLKAYPQISQWLDEWLGSDCMIEVMAKNNDNIKNS